MRWLALLALVGCTPIPPTPVPQPDADAAPMEAAPPPPGTPACVLACTAMQQAGCREGSSALCPTTMSKVETDRLTMAAMCPLDAGHATSGCAVTCAWCATAANGAEVVAKCGSSCSP